MTFDKRPSILIKPAVQAMVQECPSLRTTLMMALLEAEKVGRYKVFEGEQVGTVKGKRPNGATPGPKHGYFLSYGPHPNNPDNVMAVITDGHPKKGHANITVIDIEIFRGDQEDRVHRWFGETSLALLKAA